MEILKSWDNIEEADHYNIIQDKWNNFYGEIVDKNNKVIKSVGMQLTDIGYSCSAKITGYITEQQFNNIKSIKTTNE